MAVPLITRAYVNRGRWIAECECRHAAQVSSGDEWRCPVCGTRYVVLWPADRVAIQDALRQRPVENQNWLPTETINDLLAENIEHGISAPRSAA